MFLGYLKEATFNQFLLTFLTNVIISLGCFTVIAVVGGVFHVVSLDIEKTRAAYNSNPGLR
jgi:hypothetical protein